MKVWALEQKWRPKSVDIPTNVEEVWFAGCHCGKARPMFSPPVLIFLTILSIDVGGGSVPNGTRHSLARIPLRWMIRECFKTKSGIKFDSEKLRHIGLDPSTLLYDDNGDIPKRPPPAEVNSAKITKAPAPPKQPNILVRAWRGVKSFLGFGSAAEDGPHVDSGPHPPTTEEEEELKDALSPMYDQLEIKWYWKVLEYLPLTTRYQNSKNVWITKNRSVFFRPFHTLPVMSKVLISSCRCNRGRARIIPWQTDGLKVHRSVEMRMKAEFEDRPGKKYVPAAKFDVKPQFVP